jgi:hypothetical protein
MFPTASQIVNACMHASGLYHSGHLNTVIVDQYCDYCIVYLGIQPKRPFLMAFLIYREASNVVLNLQSQAVSEEWQLPLAAATVTTGVS